MLSDASLIFAFALDGKGGATEMDAAAVEAWSADASPMWLHMDRKEPETRAWLAESGGLSPLVVEALMIEDTRPRCTPIEGGAIVNLRGVNLNPGAEPDEMISLRMWVEPRRLISVRASRLMAVGDAREALLSGSGPTAIGGLLAKLAGALAERVEPVLDNLEEMMDELEDRTLEDAGRPGTQDRLNSTRRQAIHLHRHLRPQRDALSALAGSYFAGLQDIDRSRFREAADRTTRFVEDLEALRDRAAVLHEEALTRQSEKINRTTYVLTLVATIFLPLGFVTGLLGINVGGIPLAESGAGFLIICGALAALAVVEYLIFRWMKLL
ncbi:MAG: zinc transporter ZntB [Planctomycetota bacterium]